MDSDSDDEVVPDGEVEWIEVDDQGTPSTSDHEYEDVEFDAVERFNPPQDDSIGVFSSHRESVFCLNFDSSGRYLVSGGQDHVAIVWDMLKRGEIFRTRGHDDSITCASFSPDDCFLATGDMAGHISVWLKNPTESSCTWILLTRFSVGDLLWLRWWKPPMRSTNSTKSKQTTGTNDSIVTVLLAGDDDGLVTFWPISSNVNHSKEAANRGKCIAGSGEAALDAQILPSSDQTDRPKLVVLYRNGDLRLWDLKSTDLLATAQVVSPQTVESTVFSLVAPHSNHQQPQEQRDLVVVAGLGLIHPAVITQNQDADFQIKSLDPLKTGDNGSVEALDCSWTHPLLGFGTVDGALGVVDYRTMNIRQKWAYIDEDGNGIGITSLTWSHFAPIFFTSTVRGSVVAWPGLSASLSELGHTKSHNKPTPLRIWWGHQAMILDLVLPPNMSESRTVDDSSTNTTPMEPFLVTASDDATIRLFPLTLTD